MSSWGEESSLAGMRNMYEDEVFERLHEILPKTARITLLADLEARGARRRRPRTVTTP